jgi:hypothetical protein
MRILATLIFLLPLCGQDQQSPPPDPAPQAASESKADQAKPAAAAAPAPAPAAGEGWLTGSIEIGYRVIPNIDGSFNTYRSVVNLGEGPKLFNADFTLRDPKHRLFDRADVHASDFGGDPYSTLRVDVIKEKLYRLTADYRNIAYFNYLPSYADPLLSQGIALNENSFDTRLRSTDVQLDLLPGHWISPYLAFERNTQFGRGITVFTSDFNEFPVATLYSNQTNNYRGGVHIDLSRYHFTIEEGGTTYKDDQGASDATPNAGNNSTPFLGQNLFLNQLSELYRVRGDSAYTRALFAANPVSWASISGQFVFSQPTTTTNYTAASSGNFYFSDLATFFTTGQDILTADAKLPHTSASINVEIRPVRRLRIIEYWMTDRLHNASNALLTENLLLGGSPLTTAELAADRLAVNYSQQEIDLLYDLTPWLTLKGGYRYQWGDSTVRAPVLSGLALESGSLSRNIGIGGFTLRFAQKLRVFADAEGTSSNQIYFRTSLQNYQKAHVRGTYDLSPSWRFTGDFSLLNNNNPDPSIRNDFSSKMESVSVFWLPKGGKLFNALLDYTRSSVRSDILYLVPQTLSPADSSYRENAHTGTAAVAVKWFSFGGSFFKSSGSRPTGYYQPMIRVSVPIYKHMQWNAEWRYYGLNERFYSYENFRSNQIMASIRFFM